MLSLINYDEPLYIDHDNESASIVPSHDDGSWPVTRNHQLVPMKDLPWNTHTVKQRRIQWANIWPTAIYQNFDAEK